DFLAVIEWSLLSFPFVELAGLPQLANVVNQIQPIRLWNKFLILQRIILALVDHFLIRRCDQSNLNNNLNGVLPIQERHPSVSNVLTSALIWPIQFCLNC